ncbi:hypothetical protein MOJ79_03260 [Calidifontimicrobium sp. SYSU G02091]|uniref:hypothetical protein n=1 Tax=Calidifontimicrobium sp. SYSU G02091 TaxID=2926421 RepID=UPI001F52FFFE|nr:hypothetical protein [Calidifontimicrobium sp. SYSU G02091]MCI1190856.1 hypothetical protein [Calidifontimicrobium sp. SYSU G02091]
MCAPILLELHRCGDAVAAALGFEARAIAARAEAAERGVPWRQPDAAAQSWPRPHAAARLAVGFR